MLFERFVSSIYWENTTALMTAYKSIYMMFGLMGNSETIGRILSYLSSLFLFRQQEFIGVEAWGDN